MNSLPRQATLFLLLPLLLAAAPKDLSPMAQVKATTDKIIAIVSNPALKQAGKEKERRRHIRQAADERFDWEEMTRRALGRHWRGRTPEERRQFVDLFSRLLERTYMAKIENYSGEKVIYLQENVDGDYATVQVKVVTSKDVEIPVEYRLRRRGDQWLIYDVSIEGVSLVNNYRTQFNSIIVRSSYAKLVERLRAQVAEDDNP